MEIKDKSLEQGEWAVSFGFDQMSGLNEGTVALNAIKQYERDQVVEQPGAASIRSLFSEGVISLGKKMNDGRMQSGMIDVNLDADELFLVAKTLAHYSSRTVDELKFAMGAPSLDVSHTRIVEAGVAGFMIETIIETVPDEERFQTLVSGRKLPYGFSRALPAVK